MGQSTNPEGETPQDPEAGRVDSAAPIPLAPVGSAVPAPASPARPSAPAGTIADKGSLLEVVSEEPCPQCGKPMPVDAVVCLKCGYDIKAGKVRQTEVGVEAPAPAAVVVPDFAAPGRLDSLALTIIGALLLGAAMFVAGWFAPSGSSAGARAALVGRVALQTLVHTGTGVLAVVGAAFLVKNRLGRIDLAAARMFVCVSAFFSVVGLRYELEGAWEVVQWGTELVKWVGAMGLYWLLALGLFWKPPRSINTLAGLHFVLFASTGMLIGLDGWLARAAMSQSASGARPVPAQVSPAATPGGQP
ncbi:MAG: zinc ribbon domain-containing protein [Phycisphaerae bacterium]|nr:zinc ribbon domain-containing protein [Phycisphaerae bacterium]